mmetsp:Transcript_562/g.1344  ORF Transcript_562/g.1344 Transcript_562/m.1344 type:complete len:122 (+) Transcript_562:1264-1629(+)
MSSTFACVLGDAMPAQITIRDVCLAVELVGHACSFRDDELSPRIFAGLLRLYRYRHLPSGNARFRTTMTRPEQIDTMCHTFSPDLLSNSGVRIPQLDTLKQWKQSDQLINTPFQMDHRAFA